TRSRASSGERRRCGRVQLTSSCSGLWVVGSGLSFLQRFNASTLRGVGAWFDRFNAELLCVLGVQSLPAAVLHGVGADEASNGLTREKAVEHIEADVPPGSTHRDEAMTDIGPQRQARAAAKRFELPPHVEATPVVLE